MEKRALTMGDAVAIVLSLIAIAFTLAGMLVAVQLLAGLLARFPM
jgi:hypothetical protein